MDQEAQAQVIVVSCNAEAEDAVNPVISACLGASSSSSRERESERSCISWEDMVVVVKSEDTSC